MAIGLAPWNGRLFLGSSKLAGHAVGPGTVLPQLVHGGPGRAGGGEELGGLRGLSFYLQRTAISGDKPILEDLFPKND
jgi:oxepin-CoA hydrolase/3-oxo-5,6-dehydrosuberyl-CoA semialdehyde dehydrogenase